MVRIPVACQLTGDDASARVGDWRQFLATAVVDVRRGNRSVRLKLDSSDNAVLAAVDLARREKACCPFLDLRLLLLPDAAWLEVEAPDDAGTILDALVDGSRPR